MCVRKYIAIASLMIVFVSDGRADGDRQMIMQGRRETILFCLAQAGAIMMPDAKLRPCHGETVSFSKPMGSAPNYCGPRNLRATRCHIFRFARNIINASFCPLPLAFQPQKLGADPMDAANHKD